MFGRGLFTETVLDVTDDGGVELFTNVLVTELAINVELLTESVVVVITFTDDVGEDVGDDDDDDDDGGGGGERPGGPGGRGVARDRVVVDVVVRIVVALLTPDIHRRS